MSRTFLSYLSPNKKFEVNTNQHGEERAYVVTVFAMEQRTYMGAQYCPFLVSAPCTSSATTGTNKLY